MRTPGVRRRTSPPATFPGSRCTSTSAKGPIEGDDLRYCRAAEAVLAVHSVGVLHRDIKPSNVLLEGRAPCSSTSASPGSPTTPGSRSLGGSSGPRATSRRETLYGEEATTASDVHSWGATVAFAAAGTPPFGRGPAMAIMDRVRRGEHDLSGVPAEIPPKYLSPDAPPGRASPRSSPTCDSAWRQRPPADQLTMPLALANPRHDDDATDVIATDQHAVPDGALTVASDLRRRPDRHAPGGRPGRRPHLGPAGRRGAAAAARVPARVRTPASWRPPPNGTARVQRGLLLAGLFALVSLGFALAPYLSLVAIGAAFLVRTYSWTAEASQDRVWRRGRRW